MRDREQHVLERAVDAARAVVCLGPADRDRQHCALAGERTLAVAIGVTGAAIAVREAVREHAIDPALEDRGEPNHHSGNWRITASAARSLSCSAATSAVCVPVANAWPDSPTNDSFSGSRRSRKSSASNTAFQRVAYRSVSSTRWPRFGERVLCGGGELVGQRAAIGVGVDDEHGPGHGEPRPAGCGAHGCGTHGCGTNRSGDYQVSIWSILHCRRASAAHTPYHRDPLRRSGRRGARCADRPARCDPREDLAAADRSGAPDRDPAGRPRAARDLRRRTQHRARSGAAAA